MHLPGAAVGVCLAFLLARYARFAAFFNPCCLTTAQPCQPRCVGVVARDYYYLGTVVSGLTSGQQDY